MGHDLYFSVYVIHDEDSNYCQQGEQENQSNNSEGNNTGNGLMTLKDLCCRVIYENLCLTRQAKSSRVIIAKNAFNIPSTAIAAPVSHSPSNDQSATSSFDSTIMKLWAQADEDRKDYLEVMAEERKAQDEERDEDEIQVVSEETPVITAKDKAQLEILPLDLQNYLESSAWHPCPACKHLAKESQDGKAKKKKKANVFFEDGQDGKAKEKQPQKELVGRTDGRFGAFGSSQYSLFSPYTVFKKEEHNAGVSGDGTTHSMGRDEVIRAMKYFVRKMKEQPPATEADKHAAKTTKRMLRLAAEHINQENVEFVIVFH